MIFIQNLEKVTSTLKKYFKNSNQNIYIFYRETQDEVEIIKVVNQRRPSEEVSDKKIVKAEKLVSQDLQPQPRIVNNKTIENFQQTIQNLPNQV